VNRPRISARAVLFDWDGTLLDSYHSDARAYLEMFHALGIPWALDDLARHYFPDWYRIYRAARLPRSRWEEAEQLWRCTYKKESPRLVPGARRVVRALERQFTLGLVTGGNRRRVRRQLRHFNLARAFRACVCGEDVQRRKPHPAPLELALCRLRLDPEACVYVGDSGEDMEMARRAGVRAIGVLGPFPTHVQVQAARPTLLLETIAELPRFLVKDASDR
jgi:HAD superfamily hydrolase (TIGR01509 family)